MNVNKRGASYDAKYFDSIGVEHIQHIEHTENIQIFLEYKHKIL